MTLEPEQNSTTRTIINNGAQPKVYQVTAVKTTSPTAKGEIVPMVAGELLYTPKRFTLHGGQQAYVKFFYNGPSDNIERYYRVIYTESPAARADNLSRSLDKKSALDMNFAIDTVFVVRPREIQFEYELLPVKNTITNTGNAYFEFMVKKNCEQPDGEADSKYLLPGEIYSNPGIGKQDTIKIIVYQNRFIPVGSSTMC